MMQKQIAKSVKLKQLQKMLEHLSEEDKDFASSFFKREPLYTEEDMASFLKRKKVKRFPIGFTNQKPEVK